MTPTTKPVSDCQCSTEQSDSPYPLPGLRHIGTDSQSSDA